MPRRCHDNQNRARIKYSKAFPSPKDYMPQALLVFLNTSNQSIIKNPVPGNYPPFPSAPKLESERA